MFSKGGVKYWIWLFFFILGCLITYISTQFKYFNFDTEINVADLIISTVGLALGIYIVIIIDGKKNRSQNFYSYVEGKFDSLWQDFIAFSAKIEYSPRMELHAISKDFMSMEKKTGPLKKIFETSEYNIRCISSIEERLDELHSTLSSSERIKDNIVDLESGKDELIKEMNSIHELFAESYKDLNHIS